MNRLARPTISLILCLSMGISSLEKASAVGSDSDNEDYGYGNSISRSRIPFGGTLSMIHYNPTISLEDEMSFINSDSDDDIGKTSSSLNRVEKKDEVEEKAYEKQTPSLQNLSEPLQFKVLRYLDDLSLKRLMRSCRTLREPSMFMSLRNSCIFLKNNQFVDFLKENGLSDVPKMTWSTVPNVIYPPSMADLYSKVMDMHALAEGGLSPKQAKELLPKLGREIFTPEDLPPEYQKLEKRAKNRIFLKYGGSHERLPKDVLFYALQWFDDRTLGRVMQTSTEMKRHAIDIAFERRFAKLPDLFYQEKKAIRYQWDNDDEKGKFAAFRRLTDLYVSFQLGLREVSGFKIGNYQTLGKCLGTNIQKVIDILGLKIYKKCYPLNPFEEEVSSYSVEDDVEKSRVLLRYCSSFLWRPLLWNGRGLDVNSATKIMCTAHLLSSEQIYEFYLHADKEPLGYPDHIYNYTLVEFIEVASQTPLPWDEEGRRRIKHNIDERKREEKIEWTKKKIEQERERERELEQERERERARELLHIELLEKDNERLEQNARSRHYRDPCGDCIIQ